MPYTIPDMRVIALLGVLVGLAACVGPVGPNHSDSFGLHLEQAFGVSSSEMLTKDSGICYADFGFGDSTWRAAVLAEPGDSRRGVIVETTEFVAFAAWVESEGRYLTVWKVMSEDFREVVVAESSYARRIILTHEDDYKTFAITKGGNYDAKATEALGERLIARIGTDS